MGHHTLPSVASVCWTWWGREGKRLSQDWSETAQFYLVLMECLSGEAHQGSHPSERQKSVLYVRQSVVSQGQKRQRAVGAQCSGQRTGWGTDWILSLVHSCLTYRDTEHWLSHFHSRCIDITMTHTPACWHQTESRYASHSTNHTWEKTECKKITLT